MNKLSEEAVEGLLAVRSTGRVNMFSLNEVAAVTNELGYYETVIACVEQKKPVVNFILTWERCGENLKKQEIGEN